MIWQTIKAEYIAGGTSYRKLAQKYKDEVSFEAIKRRAKEEKWVELRTQAEHKATTDIVNKIGKHEAKRAVKLDKAADKLLEKIIEIIDVVDDTQGIKHISSALKDIKDIKGFKSAADMREQEARIKRLQKEAEKEDDTVDEITITFNAGPEEWNE